MTEKEGRPALSVCLPVYNGEPYIEETIKSILNQTFREFELLIVDNASTDHTVEIIRKIQDARIRLIENEKNIGMVNNWNVCLKEASAEIVQFVCADDRLLSTCLEKKYDMFVKNPDVVLVSGGSYVVNDAGRILVRRRKYRKNRVVSGVRFARASFRLKNVYGEPTNVMFKKNVPDGGFSLDCTYSPDWEMWLRISAKGNIAYVGEFLTAYRISGGNETSKLIRNYRNMNQDDRKFIASARNIPELRIGRVDVACHRTVFYVMFALKFILFKFFV